MHPHHIVYVTDTGLFRPSLLSLWSLGQHLQDPAELHLWGHELSASDWQAAARVAEDCPKLTLRPRPLQPEEMAGAKTVSDRISAAAMGRLLIPQVLEGRALYIDGDTQIRGDVTPLFELEMTAPIAAVRDFVIAKSCAKGLDSAPDGHLASLQGLMDPAPPGSYVNTGVLLLDCDAIRAEPALLSALSNLDAAGSYGNQLDDQDHVNHVFRGRVQLLNPAWNSSWGREERQRDFARQLGGQGAEITPMEARILHFHGPNKPWLRPRRDLWSQRARRVYAYRRLMRAFTARFPDLSPAL